MPRRCSICQHPDLAAIDERLVEGAALSKTAAIYRVSEDALGRHKEKHLPAKLVRAKQVRDGTEADALMARVLIYEQQARDVYDAARGVSDLNAALRAITTARNTTALLVNMREKYDLEKRLEALEQEIENDKRRKGRGHGFH